MDEVVKRLAGEGVNLVAREEEVIPIDHGGAGARETSGVVETVKAFLRRGGLEDGWVPCEELATGIRGGEVGVAGEVALFENVVPDREAILDAEPIAPVVAGAAELRRAGDWFEESLPGLHAKVEAAEVEGLF